MRMTSHKKVMTAGLLTIFMQACAPIVGLSPTSELRKAPELSKNIERRHLSSSPINSTASQVPPLAQTAIFPPQPKIAQKQATYSVVVNKADINTLLFALARDAKINLDVHSDVTGTVTLNAIDQTLPQILSRLAKQIDIYFEFENGVLTVMRDVPFLRQYKVDYVNMSRNATANVSVATQISSTGRGAATNTSTSTSTSGANTANNNSLTSISSKADNHFWDRLVANLRDILREADKVIPEDSSKTEGASTVKTSGADSAGTGGLLSAVASTVKPATPADSASTKDGTGASAGRSSLREAASVIANPETGVVNVRATHRQHEKIQVFISSVMQSARRQVLIEASVVEVQLSNEYRQGINWQLLSNTGRGFRLTQQPGGTNPLQTGAIPGGGPGGLGFASNLPGTPPNGVGGFTSGNSATQSLFTLSYLNTTSAIGNVAGAVSLLESFGRVKVLSSPKISALNNQTALLKVVDNKIYFTLEVNITPATTTSAPIVTYNSIVNTVPVGFVMSVTPQINENGVVTLNMRPTISRITNYVLDPSPALVQVGVSSKVPEIQTREMESIMQVPSGQIAVMGGLIQDSIETQEDGIPGANDIPVFGNFFKYKNNLSKKSELVIFIRPVVIQSSGIEGDFAQNKQYLPNRDFFNPATP